MSLAFVSGASGHLAVPVRHAGRAARPQPRGATWSCAGGMALATVALRRLRKPRVRCLAVLTKPTEILGVQPDAPRPLRMAL